MSAPPGRASDRLADRMPAILELFDEARQARLRVVELSLLPVIVALGLFHKTLATVTNS